MQNIQNITTLVLLSIMALFAPLILAMNVFADNDSVVDEINITVPERVQDTGTVTLISSTTESSADTVLETKAQANNNAVAIGKINNALLHNAFI